MTAAVLGLRVVGVPVTQGSMTGFVVKTKAGGHRAIVQDQKKPKLKPWREAVRSDAVARLGEDWQAETGPLCVILRFALPRPASAPVRRRTWPIGARSGDVDKLARAILDALTDAALWRDDSQVIDLRVRKDYPGLDVAQMTPGVLINVYRVLDGAPVPETPTQEGLPIP